MSKRKTDLATFNEVVLPSLQAKYSDNDTIQKHIDDNYEISDDKGPVTIKIATKAASPADTGKVDELAATIKTMAGEIATLNAAKPNNIEVGNPCWMDSSLKMYKPIRNITGDTENERRKGAYAWGAYILGHVISKAKPEYAHLSKYATHLENMKIHVKAQGETVNTAGGVLVPVELENYIIVLRETYGVARRNTRIVPMSRDTLTTSRRTSGLTAYFAAESEALTASQKGWDAVQLTAKKLTCLAKMSSEIIEDAIISLGDDLAGEISWAFSNKEDECFFNGNGNATYGNIYGICPKLKATVGATTTSAGGVVVGTGNLMSELTLADHHAVVGVLPNYADTPNTKWICHRYYWSNVMERLARAAGGVTAAEIRGSASKSFLGYPVEISQVMPKTDANSQIVCLFGDFTLGTTLGDRRETTISISDQAYWANDQIGIKGTERFDMNIHDIGTATVAGPIVGLQSLNS